MTRSYSLVGLLKWKRLAGYFCWMALSCFGSAPEPVSWLFEGRLDHIDPNLAPDLKSGWVLSGSFLMDSEKMAVDPGVENAALRYTGGISAGELTVDLYYSLKFAAEQNNGPAGFDILHSEDAESVSIVFFFPLSGSLGVTDWSLKWLQISVSGFWPRFEPKDFSSQFDWERGVFRMLFTDSTGSTAHAMGSLTLLGPADLAELNEAELWRAALSDLGATLVKRDATIAFLEDDLQDARTKLGALQRMLDFMAEERIEMDAEIRRLELAYESQPLAFREKEAAFLAERALLQQELEDARTRNEELEANIQAMTDLAAQLQLRLNALKEEEAPKEEDSLNPVELAKNDPSEASIRIVEYPAVVEPIHPPQGVASEAAAPSTATEEDASKGVSMDGKRARRLGPRKFR